jgi:beta-barrel assembly-enhancing protease
MALLSWKRNRESGDTKSKLQYCWGPTRAHIIAIALLGKLHSLGYSRDAESKSDVNGADICAQAGYNPWGLAWLFQDFQNADVRQIPQLLSDHPANGTRIQTLEKQFQDNPSTFSKFSRDPKSAHPFSVPKDALCSFCALRSKVVSNLGSDRDLDR